NNSVSDIDTLAPVADLSITKTDTSATATPGLPVSYQIVATNNGPSDIIAATVSDIPPAVLSGVTWSCAATGNGACADSTGATSINELVDLPVGATVTLSLTGALNASSSAALANTATIAPPAGATDPDPANNTATDTAPMAPVADLSVTKTADHPSAVPGDVVTYTIVVANDGPSDIVGAAGNDVVPGDITLPSWTCTPVTGGSCADPGPISGNLATTVNLAATGSVSFTLSGVVAPLASGTIVHTATVTAPAGATDPSPANNTATASTSVNPKADLSITKTDGNLTAVAGTSIQYSIVVTNNGPSTITDAPVSDVMPSELSSA